MSRREVGQARGVEEGLEQWAHRGAKVGLALERALWVPRPERGPGLEWTAWAPGTERALERTLSAPGTERALERTLMAPGTERALERTLSASGLERALQLTPPWRLSRLNSEPGWCSPLATLLGPSKASGIWRAWPGLPRRRPWGRYSPSPTDEWLPRSAWRTPQFSRLPDGYWRASPLDPSLLANSLLSPLLADPFCQVRDGVEDSNAEI